MTAVAAPRRRSFRELIGDLPLEGRLYLEHVPWSEYAQLVDDLMGIRHIHISYDQGRMEIMPISAEHDGFARLFGYLVQILTEELGLEFASRGSMTMMSENREKGAEADDCFYIEDLQRILGKKRVNMDVDAPPDLAIEVDITSPTLSKLPIYAGLGIAELWRYHDNQIEFYQREGETYCLAHHSQIFPFLTTDVLVAAVQQGDAEGINTMRRHFRQWVQAHKP